MTDWAAALTAPPAGCTYLNFTASHDGIGVRPLRADLEERLHALVSHVRARGGAVSCKHNADGSESPYELNIAWFDAMRLTDNEPNSLQLARFFCSQTIPLVLRGIPAVYVHSLLATPNDVGEVQRTGHPRAINRGHRAITDLNALLRDPTSMAAMVLREMTRRLALRSQHPAFHPDALQRVHRLGPSFFAVERIAADGGERVLAISHVSSAAGRLSTAALPEPSNCESSWLTL